jgi:small subunit ribosomal protein S6
MTQDTVRSYSALRNTQREFETTMILRPDINKDGLADLVNRLQALLQRNGARMQKIDNWGLRTLAYPILGYKKGIYLYVRYLGGSDVVKELERNLRIYDEVVRYLTVVIDGDVNPDARPSSIDAESLDAASEVAPDPLDIAAEKAAAMAGHDADDDYDDEEDDDDDDDEEDDD